MSFGRLERPTSAEPMAEINMTPLIDVMLVLLVIFMITAPLMTSGLQLQLPKADAVAPAQAPAFIVIALDKDGQLFLGNEALEREALAARVAEAGKGNPQLEVQLRADQAVPYGRVAEVIGLVQQAGLLRIAFVAEPAAPSEPSKPSR